MYKQFVRCSTLVLAVLLSSCISQPSGRDVFRDVEVISIHDAVRDDVSFLDSIEIIPLDNGDNALLKEFSRFRYLKAQKMFLVIDSRQYVFYAFSLFYMLLMARYVALFNHYYKHYRQLMDNYFSDSERKRLHWVPVAFYSAFGVGIIALLFAWMITPLTQLLFMLTAVVYYSVFAVRFMNYVYIFPKIKEPLEDSACEVTDTEEMPIDVSADNASADITATEDDQSLMEQIERLMQEKALYKTPDLSIANVATLCGKSHRVVSTAINHCRGINFKTYIN